MADDLVDVVMRARRGDSPALGCLVLRFQDYAMACAIGYGVDRHEACDVAQEAFLSLPSRLPELRVPEAFPTWFRRLIRTYALRHVRAQRPIDLNATLPDRVSERETARVPARDVDRTLRHLTEAQRMVVALQYFAGLSQPEIAEFLDLPLSTVKKRAHDARAHLRRVLPLLQAAGSSHAPSRTSTFSQTIELFTAIRRQDAVTVKRLVRQWPQVVSAREAWTVDDGLAAGLGASGSATPLVRAATVGSTELLDLLLDAGADINAVCDCETRESALWAAVEVGSVDCVQLLLTRGADPNLSAALGITPLHLAAMRGNDDIVQFLVAAGADEARIDAHGRSARDWRRPPSPRDNASLHTGIKAIDLFLAFQQRDRIAVASSYGLGLRVLLTELSLRLPGPVTWIVDPSSQNPLDAVVTGTRELGAAGAVTVTALPREADVDEQLAVAETVLRESRPSLLVLIHGDTRSTALDALLPSLPREGGPSLVLVVGASGHVPTERSTADVPEGFDAVLALDPRRAHANLWPAIDLTRTRRRHSVAAEAQRVLKEYDALDPQLAMTPQDSAENSELAARGQALHRYLTQPFRTAEPHTATPSEWTSAAELTNAILDILSDSRTPREGHQPDAAGSPSASPQPGVST